MNLIDLKSDVQIIFPLKFEETLIYEDDSSIVDKILNKAVRTALSKYEKVRSLEIVGTQHLPEALNVLKVVYTSEASDSTLSIWDTIPGFPQARKRYRLNYYFGSDRILKLDPSDASVTIEYLVDPATLSVEDMNHQYYDWVVKYADALLRIKEATLGMTGETTELPFDFNYDTMLSYGREDKGQLENDLNDMYSGVLAMRGTG